MDARVSGSCQKIMNSPCYFLTHFCLILLVSSKGYGDEDPGRALQKISPVEGAGGTGTAAGAGPGAVVETRADQAGVGGHLFCQT